MIVDIDADYEALCAASRAEIRAMGIAKYGEEEYDRVIAHEAECQRIAAEIKPQQDREWDEREAMRAQIKVMRRWCERRWMEQWL